MTVVGGVTPVRSIQVSGRGVGVAIALLLAASCESSVFPPGYLPEHLEGTFVGQITEVGENLSAVGPRPGGVEILVEERPAPGNGRCAATFFEVSPTADISIWQRAEEVRAGTPADLKVGAVVRVFLAQVPCFSSCPGICVAKSVQVFER